MALAQFPKRPKTAPAPVSPPSAARAPHPVAIAAGVGCLAFILLALAIVAGGGLYALGAFDGLGAAKISQVTYVYEKDDGDIPSPVAVALSKLNERDILATKFEQDTKNGNGETPAQYQVALAAAQKAGLPAAVFQAGSKVVRVIKNPVTESHIMEKIP